MTNEIKEILSLLNSTSWSNEAKQIADYITNLQEENKIIDKIKKLRNANTHIENIYYAEGVLLNEPYCDIEDVNNEELLDILKGGE